MAEELQGLTFERKRAGDSDFSSILTIPPSSVPGLRVFYDDPSLEARTVVKRPDSSLSTSVSVTFFSAMCSDIAEYKLDITYYSGGNLIAERTAEVNIKGKI